MLMLVAISLKPSATSAGTRAFFILRTASSVWPGLRNGTAIGNHLHREERAKESGEEGSVYSAAARPGHVRFLATSQPTSDEPRPGLAAAEGFDDRFTE